MRKFVPEYRKFDAKIHDYVVSTGGGDAWSISDYGGNLNAALIADFVDTYGVGAANRDKMREHITELFVNRKNEDDDYQPVAVFDVRRWRWS